MSDITIATLPRITRQELSAQILSAPNETLPSSIVIIDVRDSDHVGGHIKGSRWVPSSQLDYSIPELVRELKDKEIVVFHCALSQQRGPGAALRYIREKRRLDPAPKDVGHKEGESVVKEGDVQERRAGEKKGTEQKVVVLDGGFTKWQEDYGADKRLTEGWRKDIWEFGY